jgi:transcriptional regulator with XRE-family HTH domain
MTAAQLDVQALHAALDAQRMSRGLSWRQAAAEAKVSPSTLTRLGQGKRPDVDSFAALVHWMGVPPESFLRAPSTSARRREPDLITVISTHLRARKELTPKSAKALEDIIRAAYEQLKTRNAET